MAFNPYENGYPSGNTSPATNNSGSMGYAGNSGAYGHNSRAVPNCSCSSCTEIREKEERERYYLQRATYGVDFGQSVYRDEATRGMREGSYINIYPGEIYPSYQEQGVHVDRHGELMDDFLNTPYGLYERVKPKPKEPERESWCKCGRRRISDSLDPAFMDGIVEFKKQWFVSQNLLTQEDIDSIESEHDKFCSSNHFHNWYSELNDTPLY